MQASFADYIKGSKARFVEDFRTFVRQPSVSAQSLGMVECSRLLRDMMQSVGIDSKIVQTRGHPLVYGEVKSKKSRRTLLVYDHYDVQPPEPLEKWHCDPFEGKIEGDRIYGRGTSDSKGNVFAYIKAVEAFLKTTRDVPCNLKFIWEGEEEEGSPHLATYLREHKEELQADEVHMCDGRMGELSFGSKGLCYLELRVRTADHDLHSGKAGPIVDNAAWKLIWFLNSLKSADGRVKIAGFYDDVVKPSPADKKAIREMNVDANQLKSDMGLDKLPEGKSIRDLMTAQLFYPTCNIAGFQSGYTGSGSKTVLPGDAMCKIDMRLVVNQRSDDIYKKFMAHLKEYGPRNVEVKRYPGGEASKTPLDAPIGKVMLEAHRRTYGTKPLVAPAGWGSIPFWVWSDILGLKPVLGGSSTGYVNAHAPNEWNTLSGLMDGIRYFGEIAKIFGNHQK